LEEEREVLKDPEGFKIIPIPANHPSNMEVIWAKASAKFFQTMKEAQGNYSIVNIGVIVNTKLRRRFEQKKSELQAISEKRANLSWGFHGTTPESILAISKDGFKHPDELKKTKEKRKLNYSTMDILVVVFIFLSIPTTQCGTVKSVDQIKFCSVHFYRESHFSVQIEWTVKIKNLDTIHIIARRVMKLLYLKRVKFYRDSS